MRFLKQSGLFLLGVVLIVFGFRANAGKAVEPVTAEVRETAAQSEAVKEADEAKASGQAKAEEESKAAGQKAQQPKSAARAKTTKTRLEKAKPEKATGSK